MAASITRVSKSCLEDLLKKDSAEGEIAKLYKITDDHVLGHKDSE